jgi:hypothetical protein
MKKALAAAAAALVAVAAAPAFAGEASPTLTYGGFMRFNLQTGNPGSFTANFPGLGDPEPPNDGATAPDDSVSFWEYRIRQFFDAKLNEYVSANVKFEFNADFGQEQTGDLSIPNDGADFRLKHAFIRTQIPNSPVAITFGQQDFSTPKALISVEDGAGIKVDVNAFGANTSLWWQRLDEGGNRQTAAEDGDWFGIAPSFNAGGITVSPHLSWVKTGPGQDATPLADAEVFFFGVDTTGKLGNFGFTADLIFEQGDLGPNDLFSYIADVSVSLVAGPGTLTLKGLYSPGDDNLTDADTDSWVGIATDLGWSPFFHDGSDNNNFAGTPFPAPGAGGIMAVGAEFALSPTKALTVTPNAYYLMAAEDTNLSGGNPDDFYGIEAGVQAAYVMADVVTWLAQFDYLFAGDAYEDAGGNADDAWRFLFGPRLSW